MSGADDGTTIGVTESTKDIGDRARLGETWDDFLKQLFKVVPPPHRQACANCGGLAASIESFAESEWIAYRVRQGERGDFRTLLFCDHRCLSERMESLEKEATAVAATD